MISRTISGVALASAVLLVGCNTFPNKVARNPNDEFKVLPNSDVEARWCLNRTVPVVQPDKLGAWHNSNKVVLETIYVPTNCEVRDVFEEGDELTVHRVGVGGLRLTIKDPQGQARRGWDTLTLTADSPGNPRYWFATAGALDVFVLLAERRNSQDKLVKYYRIEAFSDSDKDPFCMRERPDYERTSDDHSDALVKITSGVQCPDITQNWLRQTGVSGGGEGK